MKKLLLTAFICTLSIASFAQAGTLDSTFGVDGVVNSLVDSGATCWKLIALPGNKLLAAGNYKKNGRFVPHITRYSADGSIDNSFATNGTAIADDTTSISIFGAVMQPDGKVLVCGDYYNGAGYNFRLVRFKADGSVDSSFGNNGRVSTPVGNGSSDNIGRNVLLQADGKIIMAGTTYVNGNSDFIVLRYKTDGLLDSSYGTNGMTVTAIGSLADNAYAIAMQADGKVIHVGDHYDGSLWSLAVLRYDTSGHLDNGFGTGGQVVMPLGTGDIYGYSVLVQGSQKIVVGAFSQTYNNTLLRFNSDGSQDNSFGDNGICYRSFATSDHANFIDTLSNGDIILANRSTLNSTYAFAKFSGEGLLDTSIGDSGLVVVTVNNGYDYSTTVAVDGSNHIIIGGYTNTANGNNIVMARFKSGVPVGIKEHRVLHDAMLYPNPAEGDLVLDYALADNDRISVSVYDELGRLGMRVKDKEQQYAGKQSLHFTLSKGLPAGNYVLSIAGSKGVYGTVKFVKR